MQDPPIRLRNAVVSGNVLIVKRLLTRFPNLLTNIDTSNGWSNLHYACFHGHYLICYHLVSLGHDVNELSLTFKNETPIHLALLKNHTQILKFLLVNFPKTIDHKDINGQTGLHYASVNGDFVCMEILLVNRSHIDIQDNDGNTALHLALKYGQINCVKILVNHKANDQIRNSEGWLPSDLSSSFDIENQYRIIKRTPINYIENSNPNSTASSRRSSESDSPTKVMLVTPFQQICHKNSGNFNSVMRQHSQSTPPLPPQNVSRKFSTTSLRSPSNVNLVNYTLTSPNPNGNTSANKNSPVDSNFQVPLLPSIKSVSISPRKTSSEYAPSSPVSTMSTRSFRTANTLQSSTKKRSSSLSSSFNQYLNPTNQTPPTVNSTPKIEESESEEDFEEQSIKSVSDSSNSQSSKLTKTQKILRHIRSTPALNNFDNINNHNGLSSKSPSHKFSLTGLKNLINDNDSDEYDKEDRKISINSQTKILNIPISSSSRDPR